MKMNELLKAASNLYFRRCHQFCGFQLFVRRAADKFGRQPRRHGRNKRAGFWTVLLDRL